MTVRERVVGAVRRRVRAFELRGDAVECPCCDSRFARFLEARERTDRICPRCGSRDRHRALWLYLRDRMRIGERTPLRMLHFAPEYALEQRLRRVPGLDYTTTDLEPGTAMVAADITSLPFADESVDAILCIHVLEHVEDERRALAEMRRVLAPAGWAIVMVPIDMSRPGTLEDPSLTTPEQRRAEYWQEDHVRLYGRDLPQRLAGAGFRVEVDEWVRHLPLDAIERFGLFPLEDVYVCRA